MEIHPWTFFQCSLITYEMGIFNQAGVGIVPTPTIERKIMSTKTSIKRIALVAAAALTLGGFSAVSANAAPNPTYAANGLYDTVNGYQVVGGQATLSIGFDTNTVATVVSSGVGTIVSATPVSAGYETITALSSTGFQHNVMSNNGSILTDTVTVVLTSSVTGVQTITITPLTSNGTPGTAVTKTVTWTAAGSTAAASWSAYLIDTATGATTSSQFIDSTIPLFYSKALNVAASTPKAELVAKLKDANGNAVSSAVVAVTVSGPGLIIAQAANNGGVYTGWTPNARVASVTTGADGYVAVGIGSDGSAGVGTITLTAGTVSVSRSVTWTGSGATYTAASGVGYLAVGTNVSGSVSSTSYAVKVKVVDSAGNLVSGEKVYVSSSDKTVATLPVANYTTSTDGYAYFDVTGVTAGKATLTFQNTDPTGTTAATVSTTAAVEVTSGTADKVTMAFDKSSYAPGEKGSLLITLTNAAGRPVADGSYNIFSATGALVASLQTQPNTAGTGTAAFKGGETITVTSGGVAQLDFFAPVVAGTFTITGTTLAASTVSSALTQNARALPLTATATITSAGGSDASLALDAANAATDAANNAYDEAQNATQAASDALAAVKALAVQVKALIALVTKIKNKVGA